MTTETMNSKMIVRRSWTIIGFAIIAVIAFCGFMISTARQEAAARRENDLHFAQNWPQEKLRAIEQNNEAYYSLSDASKTCFSIPIAKLQDLNEDRDMECISMIRALYVVAKRREKNEVLERRSTALKGLADALETKPDARK